MTVPVLQVKNLYKLFIPLEHSQNEKKAMAMLEQGASRTEVQEATGITAGLIDINFTVNKGEVFVLIGLSGSGKSTLIRCLNMLNPPTSGTVYLEGDNITLRLPWCSRTSDLSATVMFWKTPIMVWKYAAYR